MDDDIEQAFDTSVAEHESYRHSGERTEKAIQDGNFVDDLYPNERTETEIHFRAKDVNEPTYWRNGQRYDNKWAYLNHIDSGMHANDRSQQNRREGYRRDINSFLDHLDQERPITDYHERRVKHVLEQVDDLRFGQIPIETTILATISLVLDEDTNMGDVRIRQTKSWDDLLDWTNATTQNIRTMRTKMREQL